MHQLQTINNASTSSWLLLPEKLYLLLRLLLFAILLLVILLELRKLPEALHPAHYGRSTRILNFQAKSPSSQQDPQLQSPGRHLKIVRIPPKFVSLLLVGFRVECQMSVSFISSQLTLSQVLQLGFFYLGFWGGAHNFRSVRHSRPSLLCRTRPVPNSTVLVEPHSRYY